MNKSVRRITDGAMMIAIVGVLLLIDRQLGNVLTYSLMFLLPLPMVFYGAKYDWKASWVVYAAMVLISVIVSTPDTIFYVASEGFLGMAYGAGIYKKVSSGKLLALAMVIGVIVNVIDTVLISALLGYGMNDQVTEMSGMMQEAFSKAGIAMPATVNLSQFIFTIIIVASVLTGILQGYVTHVLSRLLLRRLRFHVEPATPIGEVYPPKWTGYVGLALFVLYYWTVIHPFDQEILQDTLQGIGMIGYIYLVIFGIIACAVLAALRHPKGRWAAVLFAILLSMIMPMILLFLGFFYVSTDLHHQMMEGAGIHAGKTE